MAVVPFHTLFRQTCRLSAPPGAGVPSDRELVRRVVAARDEAAFEVIVWRHGPMVLGICRRLLGNEQDAEDAFQATFLALVRKAGSISRRQALASWLYRVAYRVALRARATRARRAEVEQRRAANVSALPASEPTAFDLKEVLDAELERLPERYRLPVVLCYLQGRSTDEAARELGCPRGTVLSRLARARERLRGRFLRRGVALSAGAVSAALGEQTAPALVPASLVRDAVRTGLGSGTAAVAAPVAALSAGVLKAMLLTRLQRLAALAAAVAVVAGTGVLSHRALAQKAPPTPATATAVVRVKEQATQAAPAAKPKLPTHPVTVTGTAVDAQGKPVPGATIYLLSTNRIDETLGTTRTDRDGRYVFTDAPLPVDRPNAPEAWPGGTFQVYGTAPGHGFAWHGMRFFHVRARPAGQKPAGEDFSYYLGEPLVMNLTFRSAAKLHGRLVDEAGRPVTGARVILRGADYLDVAGKETHVNCREFWGLYQVDEKRTTARSDAAGRFQLDGLPPEVCFWVWVEHPDYALFTLYAVTTDRAVTERDNGGQKQVVHSGALDLTLQRPRRVVLRVIYDDTGKPAPGVRVSTSGEGADAVGYSAWGTTDGQGRLVLKLPPGEYPFCADPTRERPCIRTQGTLMIAKAPDEQTGELRMNPGCVLTLRVVDEATGKGIPQIRFGEERGGAPGNWASVSGDTGRIDDPSSNANGEVRVVLAPGKRQFKVGLPPLPAGYEVVPSDDDVRGPGTRAVELPAGGTVTATFKLRKK